jgi:hypothetical protein
MMVHSKQVGTGKEEGINSVFEAQAGRNRAVGTGTGYGLEDRGVGVRVLVEESGNLIR